MREFSYLVTITCENREQADTVINTLDGGTLADVKVVFQKPEDEKPSGLSLYARLFDETNPQWMKDVEHNRIFIQAQERYFNHKLSANGHVFLNEVYDALGFDRTTQGQLLGWLKDGDGDNYVDFGIFNERNVGIHKADTRIWLDFNVDGVIYDKIEV